MEGVTNMIWFKLLRHDLKQGLFRIRYMIVPLIAWLPCISHAALMIAPCTWMDLMMTVFKGQVITEPIHLPLPILWLFTMTLSLFLSLDYFLDDLSLTGQQLLVRCSSRRTWFLSKCIWNLGHSLLYFLLIGLGVFLYAVLKGHTLSMNITGPGLQRLFLLQECPALSPSSIFVLGILSPLAALAAINLLQMTLSLFIKPILSVLSCLGFLLLSVVIPSPWILGNGAMTMRSRLITPEGFSSATALFVSFAVILGCFLVGLIYFQRIDLIPSEDL